ncbi:MAG: hypothetical protein ACTSRS_11510 [Candidatus Helarchaeota archaeon]
MYEINMHNEVQFLFYLIPVTIGVQLTTYFFYQYLKIKDVNLKLNRILVSYGIFTFMVILGALFLNIQRLFGGTATDIFFRVGWALALTAPVGFLSYIVIKEFSAIMNLKFVKLVIGLGLIPLIVVLIFGHHSPLFIGSLPCVVLSGYYILGFQIKLIRRTMGTIRKRITRFFIGELISLASLPFAALVGLGLFQGGVNDIIYYSGVSVLSSGFLIMFISAYDFPPFYEFEWKDQLLKFFVIDKKKSMIIYYCHFEEILKESDRVPHGTVSSPQTNGDLIFPGGIIGIKTIVDSITNTENEQLMRIQQEDVLILLESGTPPIDVIYALVIKKDLKSCSHFLKKLKTVFELLFKEILLHLETIGEERELIFRSFDGIIKDVLKR